MDSILEQFDLGFNEFDFLDQEDVFNEDGYEFYKKTLTEAAEPVQKKNIFTRLIDTIKKFFAWVGRAFKRFIGWLGSLFKKKTQSADQIVSEVISEPAQQVIPENGQKKRVDVVLSRTDNSIPIQNHVDLSFKSLFCKFNTDKDSVQFSVNGINAALQNKEFNKLSDIKRQTVSVGNAAFIVATVILIMITDDAFAQKFKDLSNDFVTGKYLNSENDAQTFSDRCVALDKEFVSRYYADAADMANWTFDLADFDKFNQIIIDINKALEGVDAATLQNTNSSPIIKKSLTGLNMYAGWSANFQMAMNLLMGTMTNVYTVDASYEKSFHNVNDLAEFAEKSINAHIPAKYIAYNLYILSDDKLRGTSDIEHPAIGQSRIAFFPAGAKTVNKFAVNAWGIRSNKMEMQISNILTKNNYGNLIAKVTSSSNNSCAIALEKLIVNPSKVSLNLINKLKTEIDEACDKSGLNVRVSSDIHPNNVGFTKDMKHAKVIDYALATSVN